MQEHFRVRQPRGGEFGTLKAAVGFSSKNEQNVRALGIVSDLMVKAMCKQ